MYVLMIKCMKIALNLELLACAFSIQSREVDLVDIPYTRLPLILGETDQCGINKKLDHVHLYLSR